ncbi:MAG: IPT/TIG domain-containing protein [Actinomycetota bacterium]
MIAAAVALPGSPFVASAGATSCAPTTTTDGSWTYVAIKATGTCDKDLTASGATTFDYLVVAGGGGGGRRHGGGGGAGGMRWGSGAFGSSKTLSISVGAGGAGAPYAEGPFGSGSAGSDSSMSYTSACNPGSSSTITAVGGGSGGSTMLGTTGTGAPLLGNAGVTWTVSPPVYTSGGGGGAGGPGGAGIITKGGDGGAGSAWLPGVFTPTVATTGLGLDNALVSAGDVYFAGGGGGGADQAGASTDLPGGAGGLGGGGAGGQGGADTSIAADLTPVFGKDALANSGGGGGGGGLYDVTGVTNGLASKGGNGGSGVVILRYNSTDTRTALCVVPENRAIPPGTSPAPDPSTYAFTYTNTSGNPIVPTVSGSPPACASIYATTNTAGTTHPIYCARGFDPAYLFDTSSAGTLVVGTPPGPITLVSPSSGPTGGGTSITIDGSGFVSGATVRVGTSACTNVVFVDSTRITCDTPAGTTGVADVTVTNPDTLSATATGAFTYVAPAPTVSGVLPTSGPVAGGTSVTISGTGFVAGATVTIGGVACTSVSVTNATTLTCRTGKHAAGVVDVVVTVSSQASTGGTGLFSYVAPPPPPMGLVLSALPGRQASLVWAAPASGPTPTGYQIR